MLARGAAGRSLLPVVCDVTKEAEVKTLLRLAQESFGAAPTILVNCAGLARTPSGAVLLCWGCEVGAAASVFEFRCSGACCAHAQDAWIRQGGHLSCKLRGNATRLKIVQLHRQTLCTSGENNQTLCAGLMDGDTSAWVEMLSTNVLAVALCCREACRAMETAASWGHIITISSMSGACCTSHCLCERRVIAMSGCGHMGRHHQS